MNILEKYLEKKEAERLKKEDENCILVKIHSITVPLEKSLLQEAGMKLCDHVGEHNNYILLLNKKYPPVVVYLLRNLVLYEPLYFCPEDTKYLKHIEELCQEWHIKHVPWNLQCSVEQWLKKIILLPPPPSLLQGKHLKRSFTI